MVHQLLQCKVYLKVFYLSIEYFLLRRCFMNIVEQITRECKRKNLTIAELERNAGLSNGTIKKWESSMPKVDSLSKVAEYLHVSLDYLCSGEEQSNLNINESELLFYYNNLSVDGKNLCLEYIKGFSNAENYYKPLVNSDNLKRN